MNFSQLFSYKKLRRSIRLEVKEMTEIKERQITDRPLGYLNLLPLELKFTVFSYLSIEELSSLALVSKQLRNVIEVFRCCKSAKQLQAPVPLHETVLSHEVAFHGLDYFSKLGLLIKRSTCLYATKERLKIIEKIMMKHMCLYTKNCRNPSLCFSLVYFGKMLHTILAGWDDIECDRVLASLCQSSFSNIWKCLGLVVKSKPGQHLELELHVRYFFRRVFLDPPTKADDRALWLRKILDGWPMVHQARILYLLYGPYVAGQLQWEDLCEHTVANRNQLYVYFSELGAAFQLLYGSTQWSDDAVISVIDEITNIPNEWLAENVAALLFIAGNGIALKVLGSKAINGRIHDIAILVTSLCLVHVKAEKNLSGMVTLIRQLCQVVENRDEKIHFLNEIVVSFKDVLLDIYEYEDPGDERFTDMSHIVEAQAKLMGELIQMAFIA